jgi:hypothetical protein
MVQPIIRREQPFGPRTDTASIPRYAERCSGASRASRWPRLRPPRRQAGHTASMLKTIPLRVIPKIPPLRVMPQRRPPRVISQPTPPRVVGVGENCRQGARRAEDLHVARCMTGRPRDEAGLLTRGRRSTRCGGDRRRSNRGCQQRYVVIHPRSHDHVPFDMLGTIPGAAVIELPPATYRQLRDAGGCTHSSRFADPLSRRRVDVGPGVVCVSPRIPQVCR